MADSMNRHPSLRRALTGYLRLRDPYNRCIDSLLMLAVLYVLGWGVNWLTESQRIASGQADAAGFRSRWFLNAFAGTAAPLVWHVAIGLFAVATARIISGARHGAEDGA
jgi:hypothetical protein